MKNSKIAWTDHTFNPWWGCVKVSQGCKNCYAETFAKRTGNNVWGVDAPRRFFGDKYWSKPLKWNKEAEESGERKKVFVASMADVFEARPDVVDARWRLFDLIFDTPALDWLVLTKRPENYYGLTATYRENTRFPWHNMWIGTSVENQKRADERISELVKIPTRIHFLSVEPMLEKIDLQLDGRNYGRDFADWSERVQWVIVGGESGPKSRLFEWDWARNVRDQCAQAGVPFFMKQGGGHPNKRDQMEDFPEDLRIREFPE